MVPEENGSGRKSDGTSRRYWAYVWEESWLWQYSVNHGFLATNYGLPGMTGQREESETLAACREGDEVVSAFSRGWLLSHGTVTRDAYQDFSWNNGFFGLYGHRVGIAWKNFRPMKGVPLAPGDASEVFRKSGMREISRETYLQAVEFMSQSGRFRSFIEWFGPSFDEVLNEYSVTRKMFCNLWEGGEDKTLTCRSPYREIFNKLSLGPGAVLSGTMDIVRDGALHATLEMKGCRIDSQGRILIPEAVSRLALGDTVRFWVAEVHSPGAMPVELQGVGRHPLSFWCRLAMHLKLSPRLQALACRVRDLQEEGWPVMLYGLPGCGNRLLAAYLAVQVCKRESPPKCFFLLGDQAAEPEWGAGGQVFWEASPRSGWERAVTAFSRMQETGKLASGLLGWREDWGEDGWLNDTSPLPTVTLTVPVPEDEEKEDLWRQLETFWGKQLGPEALSLLADFYQDRQLNAWVGPYLFFPLATFLVRKFQAEENRSSTGLVVEATGDILGSFLTTIPGEKKKDFRNWLQEKSHSLLLTNIPTTL